MSTQFVERKAESLRANATVPPAKGKQQINWRPLGEGDNLAFNDTNFESVKTAIEKVFGKLPCRINVSHMTVLKAMVAVAGQGATPYQELYNAVTKWKDIEVREL